MIALLGVLAVGGVVYALVGTFGINIENVEVLNINTPEGVAVGDYLGASGTRFPNGISADATSPVAGEVRGATFTSTDTLTGVVGEFTTSVGVATTTSPYKFSVSSATSTIMSTEPATSTILYVGSYSASLGGQIFIEDRDGAGCTAITALNGVLTAYTPSVCPTE